MPRAKIGVTPNNFFLVRQYFDRAIKDNRLWDLEPTSNDKSIIAIHEFNILLAKELTESHATSDEIEEARKALQLWIDKYIPAGKWQRCLKTLRQRKSRKRLRLHHLDLNHRVYSAIKELAERFNLSLSKVIYKLAKAELTRLQENQENVTENTFNETI